MEWEIVSVNNKELVNQFLQFPTRLNEGNTSYIQPLDSDIEKVFDPTKNKFFKFGTCERFLVFNKHAEVCGRFAVFTHKKYVQKQATGGIGFVDFIDDVKVSKAIFDFAKSWHQAKGMVAMDGPINFGEREQWWGLLIEGFHEPLYGMNYNLPYYQKHFEAYGFQIYFKQLCYGRKVNAPLAPKFKLAHERISNMKNISMRSINIKQLDQFALEFASVYNRAWVSHGAGKQLGNKQAQLMFQSLKQAIDPNIAFIVYDQEEPIAMWINLPDLNQWFKHYKGKLNWLNKLRFLWDKQRKQNQRMVGLVFGIVPEWQKKGLDAYIIYEGSLRIPNKTQYIDYEMQWIGDFNPKMMSLAAQLETEVTRTLATYRILFDPNQTFEKHPVLK